MSTQEPTPQDVHPVPPAEHEPALAPEERAEDVVEEPAEEIAAEAVEVIAEEDAISLIEAELAEAPDVIDVQDLIRERDALQMAKASLEQEVERLRKDRDEGLGRLREVSKGYRNLQAEMDAFRVRMEQRADAKVHHRMGSLMKSVFDPVQNLRRAVENPGSDIGVFGTGVAMVLEQFLSVLKEQGFREVPGVGAPFDPNMHEPLALVPVMDAAQDGVILAVQDTGYLLGDKVLQVARVIVGKHEPPPAPVEVPPEEEGEEA
ncbi:MAG: nucleotide exchange factor GrpE [Deltaproteobacteria bacterium]|nr:nucleotide exchange factor GrpE [Deltaproteobacteria bacterium]